MRYKLIYPVCILILFFSLVNMVSSSEEDTAVDMWDEPRHQLVFSMDNIRLLLVNIPAGDIMTGSNSIASTYLRVKLAQLSSFHFP